MAILVYGSGIIEQFRPKDKIFTKNELIYLFKEYEFIESYRLETGVNVWCLYGENTLNDEIDLNKVLSEVIKKPVFSPVLFIHDSEINPEWKITDMLYEGYDKFELYIKRMLDETANNVLAVLQDKTNYDVRTLPNLKALGSTPDKKMLLSYSPDDQYAEFYANPAFKIFMDKTYKFLTENPPKTEPFVIFEDKKTMMIVPSDKVSNFLNKFINEYETLEQYEICTNLRDMIDSWLYIVKK